MLIIETSLFQSMSLLFFFPYKKKKTLRRLCRLSSDSDKLMWRVFAIYFLDSNTKVNDQTFIDFSKTWSITEFIKTQKSKS